MSTMESTIQNTDLMAEFVDFYSQNKNSILSANPQYVQDLKNEAIEQFKNLGIPQKKSERYKYTQVEPIFNHKFTKPLEADKINFEVEEIFNCDVPEIQTDTIILVNGFYYFKNKINGSLPGNIWIGSLAKAAREIPQVVEKYLGKIATFDDGLIALNTALFMDGVVVYMPKNTQLQKPLQIINILLSDNDLMVNNRNLFVLEENSSASIVVCDHTLSGATFLTNSLTEIYVGENAHLDQIGLQNEHNNASKIASMFVKQERASVANTNTITLHGGMVRNNIKVSLDGEGAESNTLGLYITDKAQHVDNYVFVNHAKPQCTSNQLFKGVLDNVSTGSFNGRILVSPNAQKTAAYQKNSNLLLTNDAKMNTRPQLEIYADDVKCSHGATVGQLDQEALFYLRSRGIGKEEARLLLMFAFAHEIINSIKIEPLRERIDEMISKRLRGEISKCQNCSIHCC